MNSVAVIQSRVLVLNRSFLPIHVTSLRRAFCLVYMGVAKIVDREFQVFDFDSWAALGVAAHEQGIGVVGRMIRVPRVILLQVYDRLPKKQIRFSRHNIFARDKNTCQYCGQVFGRPDLNLDHVVPRSKGGVTTWDNVVCSCVLCNLRKGGRTPLQAGMALIKQPKRPHWSECFNYSHRAKFYKEWRPYLNVTDFSYWNVELED